MPGSFSVRRVRLQLRSGWGPPQSALRRGGPRSPDSTRSSELEKRGVRNSRMAFAWLFTCRMEDLGIEVLRGWWCRQRWLISVNLGYPKTLLELTTAATTATVIIIIALELASEVVVEDVFSVEAIAEDDVHSFEVIQRLTCFTWGSQSRK